MPPGDAEFRDYVADQLGIPRKSYLAMGAYTGFVRPDLSYDHEGTLYIVETKRSRATNQTLAQLTFQRDYLSLRYSDRRWRLVIAARSIAPEVKAALRDLGGVFVQLPKRVVPPPQRRRRGVAARLTTPAAWAVVARLLGGASTIQDIARATGVSYAWCHRTVAAMDTQGLLLRRRGNVEVADIPRLLSGVAWERPLASLAHGGIETRFRKPMELLDEVMRRTEASGVRAILTGPAHLLKSSDELVRVNRVDLYLDGPMATGDLAGQGGVQLHFYRADRSLELDPGMDVPAVSRDQLVLDLAGLGREWFDLALAVVRARARR